MATGCYKECYKEFAFAVKEFIKDLMRSFPSVTEFKLIFAAYKVIKTFGKKHVYRAWCEAMGDDLEHAIRNRDDRFITSPDFSLPRSYWMYDEYVPVFRNLWLGMDDHSKDAIWRHLQHIMALGDKCKAASALSTSASLNGSSVTLPLPEP